MATFKHKNITTLKVNRDELWVLYSAVAHYRSTAVRDPEAYSPEELARIESVRVFLDDATDYA